MITSIVVNGMYNIAVNGNSKIKVKDHILHTEKDIPFVRYRLQSITDEAIEYIKGMQTKFPKSTHLVELKLDDNTVDYCDKLRDNVRIAIYVYEDITDEVVQAGELPDTVLNKLANLQGKVIDRYMLKDKSDSLDYMAAKKIIKQISKLLKVKEDNIGICESPLSFQDMQCLSAVKARELMSIYNDSSDVPLPSANHECMNCCGCIRYLEVDSDLAAPSEGRSTKKSSEAKEKEPKQPKKKNVSNVYRPGRFSF